MTDAERQRRSAIMRAVRGKDTTPEVIVRRAAHRVGLRFRLHVKELPGRPDLVLPRWRTAVFVNGCFWHRHQGCRKATVPKSNAEFWARKFNANVRRDQSNCRDLEAMGWRVVVLWQCEVRTIEAAMEALRSHFPTV